MKNIIKFIVSIVFGIVLLLGINFIRISILDNHVLIKAVEKNDSEKVKTLINQGINVNVRDSLGYSALDKALLNGNLNIIELLLENGANVNDNGPTPSIALIVQSDASQSTQLKVLNMLLKAGANINARDAYGVPLLLAVVDGLTKGTYFFDFLLDNGVDVNDADRKTGTTPLMHVSQTGDLYFVKSLLKKGANVNLVNKNKETALFRAVLLGNKDVVKELLAYGADVTVKDEFGQELTLIALVSGNQEIFNILAINGAPLNQMKEKFVEQKDLIVKLRDLQKDSVEDIIIPINKK